MTLLDDVKAILHRYNPDDQIESVLARLDALGEGLETTAERETCADICRKRAQQEADSANALDGADDFGGFSLSRVMHSNRALAAHELELAIRARGKKP